jgi:hypothetical protein
MKKHFCISILLLTHMITFTNFLVITQDPTINVVGSQRIGFNGSTAHPTRYLLKNGYNAGLFHSLPFNELMDVEKLKDSFIHLFSQASDYNIDTLIIAYLPIHFMSLKEQFPQEYTTIIKEFFEVYIPSIENIIKETQELYFKGRVIWYIPALEVFNTIPTHLTKQEYIQHLIYEFPLLKYTDSPETTHIFIFNNTGSDQNEMLIDTLKKVYALYPIEYHVVDIGTAKFYPYYT